MKISLKWLNDFIDVKEYFENPQVLADVLTKAGLEVEEIQNKAADLKNVVIGHIQIKDKHPKADKLSLCQVDIGGGKVEQIVCGAQNHKQGDKVVVALPGAVLPGNFAIKLSKIRDVESRGMLCSFKELGFATESDGIIILPADAPVGRSYAEYAGHDDLTFELKVTPNRADCLSHYGLARELGCLLDKPVKVPEVLTKFSATSTADKMKLDVLDTDLCPRYSGRYIANVKIGPSPDWLKQRLESVGQNSINNVVDITNYVMLEMGQPLHAFDADLLKGAKVEVRKAKKGEKFTTLKEAELTLTGEELVICDAEKPVALAGVIGGLNSGVSESTKNIFLESASFEAMSVRKASRKHGIETDSAYRFARGVDSSSAQMISDRAALLITQVAGGEAFGKAYDVYPKPVVKSAISISLQTVSDRLGYAADETKLLRFMKGLQVKVEKIGDGQYKMTPPVFRFDIDRDMDLVEEYARLDGYDKIQETLPVFKKDPVQHDLKYILTQKVKTLLNAQGFHQAINYAFVSDKKENEFISNVNHYTATGLKADAEAIKIRNPLSEDLNVMRRSLVTGLYANALSNIRSGNEHGQLFETGVAYLRNSSGGQTSSSQTSLFSEPLRLGLVKWGSVRGVYESQKPCAIILKETIEKLFASFSITAYTFVQKDLGLKHSHPAQSVVINVQGQNVGYLTTLHPGMLESEKIRVPVAVAEIDLETVLQGQPRPLRFKSLSKFQPVERDFAFVCESAAAIGDMTKEIKKSCGSAVRDIEVFDIYEGDKLQAGQKSVAVKVTFQNLESSLSEADIQGLSQKVIDAAQKSIKAVLR